MARLEQKRTVYLSLLDMLPKEIKVKDEANIAVQSLPSYNQHIEMLIEDIKKWRSEKFRVLILSGSKIRAERLAKDLNEYEIPAFYRESLGDELKSGEVMTSYGWLRRGFEYRAQKFIVVTEGDIFGAKQKRRKKKIKKFDGKSIQSFNELNVGDYVVHEEHGLGIYRGIEKIRVENVTKDFFKIEYGDGGNLYVPVSGLDVLQKYAGQDVVKKPKLNKLNSSEWKKTKSRVKHAVNEVAKELVLLYAKRQQTKGYCFGKDTVWQTEFEDMFPFDETKDQLDAIDATKKDMESNKVMDRLICGDVGYGKTEVAIRAAFKAVMDGKQVAVMVPTTVLAQQHFMTFKERMQPFGVKVEMVSRFCTPREQKRILNDLGNGQVDVLIGTHRLLQQDVLFPDLGLLVIDEEQRFGVAQKEKIKRWKTGVDVLTLSATPIPRTLHLALVNGRDMSVIESPPEERLPVETYVAEYNPGMIKEALEREMRRGGRIYYVHNRVLGLENIAADLRSLVPGINIRIAHGQMSEDMLEDAMIAFYEGNCDVLLSTSIIENGLDVPLANTIIIDGAENFGLSQLYQMRGRVGRSSRLAYAYFVYKRNRALSEVAEKRLQAIRDFTELGAGFKIAMRDLEIRGAGNLLGAQQHGHIAGVGFAAYCDMLERTIRKLKDGVEDGVPEPDPVLEISVDGYIPDDYIADPRYKLELYRRFADLTYAEKDDLLDEIIDRFGEPPEEVEVLWRVACLRALCRLLHIRGISVKPGELRITFAENAAIDPTALMQLISEQQQYMNFKSGAQAQLIFRTVKLKTDSLTWLEKNLPRLAFD